MAALFDMKAFYLFLETAKEQELTRKRDLLVRFIKEAKDQDVIEDAKYLLRQVEAEILSRL